jgi:hypothetical protein
VIALFLGPEVQRNGRQLVNHRDCPPVLRHVNGFDIGLAGITGIYADVIKFVRDKNGKLVLMLFTTAGTKLPTVVPFGTAKRTDQ